MKSDLVGIEGFAKGLIGWKLCFHDLEIRQ